MKTFSSIQYSLSQNGVIILSLFDNHGKLIRTISEEKRNPGIYTETVDATALADGIYFYRILLNGRLVNSGKVIVNR